MVAVYLDFFFAAAEKREGCEHNLCDFDNVSFSVNISHDDTDTLNIGMDAPYWHELADKGANDGVNEYYGKFNSSGSHDVNLTVNLAEFKDNEGELFETCVQRQCGRGSHALKLAWAYVSFRSFSFSLCFSFSSSFSRNSMIAGSRETVGGGAGTKRNEEMVFSIFIIITAVSFFHVFCRLYSRRVQALRLFLFFALLLSHMLLYFHSVSSLSLHSLPLSCCQSSF